MAEGPDWRHFRGLQPLDVGCLALRICTCSRSMPSRRATVKYSLMHPSGHDFVDGEFPEGDFFWLAALQEAGCPCPYCRRHVVAAPALPGSAGNPWLHTHYPPRPQAFRHKLDICRFGRNCQVGTCPGSRRSQQVSVLLHLQVRVCQRWAPCVTWVRTSGSNSILLPPT